MGGDHEDELQGRCAVPPGRPGCLRRRRQLHEVRPDRHERPARGGLARSSSTSTRTRHARATTPRTRRQPGGRASRTTCWMRITSDGTNITGAYSTDGNAWTPVGPPGAAAGERQDRHVLLQQRRPPRPRWPPSTRSPSPVTTSAEAPPGRAATTSSTAPRSTRPAGTRSCGRTRASYAVSGGNLTITTEPGDIYTDDTVPPPNNFILQSARSRRRGLGDRDEDRLGGQRRLRPGRPDRLRSTATTTSSSTRSPTPARRGSTASSCARRSQVRRPDRHPTRRSRLGPARCSGCVSRKTGTSYTGEYSRDGVDVDAPAGDGDQPDGVAGVRPVRLRAAGRRPGRHGRVRLLHARRPGPGPSRASARAAPATSSTAGRSTRPSSTRSFARTPRSTRSRTAS